MVIYLNNNCLIFKMTKEVFVLSYGTNANLKTELYGSEQVHIYLVWITPAFVCYTIKTLLNTNSTFLLQSYNILAKQPSKSRK